MSCRDLSVASKVREPVTRRFGPRASMESCRSRKHLRSPPPSERVSRLCDRSTRAGRSPCRRRRPVQFWPDASRLFPRPTWPRASGSSACRSPSPTASMPSDSSMIVDGSGDVARCKRNSAPTKATERRVDGPVDRHPRPRRPDAMALTDPVRLARRAPRPPKPLAAPQAGPLALSHAPQRSSAMIATLVHVVALLRGPPA